MIRLYNTMSRSVENFQPRNKDIVTIYTCGPTVYDYPHIGNWYTFLRFELLNRVLKACGYKTKWVMNITDVGHLVSDGDIGEDKLEKGAKREGKSAWQIADFYTKKFIDDLEKLNFLKPDILPRATENISEQIDLIKVLEKQNLTYKIDDGIYFDTGQLTDYGKLARLDIKNLQAGARIKFNLQKRHITDFALWKFSPKNHQRDMEWDSPWGKGFPGWHLECSTMSMKYLGETLDIHGGAIDLIPVHHTNEIAQSEGASHKKPFARFWFHTHHIITEGTKMSKSLGNIITLDDIEKKGFCLEAFRLLVLESHYRSEAQFSWDTLTAAQNRLKTFEAMADLIWQPISFDDSKTTIEPIHKYEFTNYYNDILEALEDDLNTPEALSALSNAATQIIEKFVDKNTINDLKDFLKKVDDLLGLKLSDTQDISDSQKKFIAKREIARKNNDWAESDNIRDALKEQSIAVNDTAYGPIWSRI